MTATAVIALALVVRLLSKPRHEELSTPVGASSTVEIHDPSDVTLTENTLLLPVVPLCVEDQSLEANWISAFAVAIGGHKEVVLEHGRADVLTNEFAFELDWVDKWHEGIGQALHYSTDTGKRPALALMVREPEWPLNAQMLSKLSEVDRVCSRQAIKLVLLRPQCSAEFSELSRRGQRDP